MDGFFATISLTGVTTSVPKNQNYLCRDKKRWRQLKTVCSDLINIKPLYKKHKRFNKFNKLRLQMFQMLRYLRTISNKINKCISFWTGQGRFQNKYNEKMAKRKARIGYWWARAARWILCPHIHPRTYIGRKLLQAISYHGFPFLFAGFALIFPQYISVWRHQHIAPHSPPSFWIRLGTQI